MRFALAIMEAKIFFIAVFNIGLFVAHLLFEKFLDVILFECLEVGLSRIAIFFIEGKVLLNWAVLQY